MINSSRIQHALLDRNVYEGYPYLIEISSPTNTSLEDSQFCQDYILYPRKEMYAMLKWLKHPSIFDDNDRNEVLSKMRTLIITGEDRFLLKNNTTKYQLIQ